MTYEYTCQKCGHAFEITQPITAETLTVCPKDVCPKKKWGKGKVKRAVGGGAGLLFKGSGFYITDYRSENYKASAKKEGSGSSSGGESAKKESPAPAKPSTGAATPAATPAPKPAAPKKD